MRLFQTAFLALAFAGGEAAAGGRTLQLSLGLAKQRFVSGEYVSLRVSLRNPGAAEVRIPTPFDNRNWQPEYVVRGPGGTHTSNPRLAALPYARPNPPRSQAVLATIAPGGALEGEIPLHRLADLQSPGEYGVSLRLRWGAVRAASPEVAFRVEAVRLRGAALIEDAQGPRILWLQAGDPGALMEEVLFPSVEARGELAIHLLRTVASAHSAATAPFGAPTRPSLSEALHFWVGFREPGALVVMQPGREALRVPVPDGALVAQDPFVTLEGDLDLAMADGRALSLVRLSVERPSARWRLELPEAAAAIAASERLDRKGGRRIAVLAVSRGGLEMSVVDAAAPKRRNPARADDAVAIAGSRIALRIDDSGASRAAVLVLRRGALALFDARFDASGDPVGPPRVADLVDLGESPVAAAATFRPSGEIAWVALLASGALVHSLARTPGPLAGVPIAPLQLYAREASLYLLVQPAVGAPRLQQLF
jgi:hypothetical protein